MRETIEADILLDLARQGTPVIDGETATFVWHGAEAPHLMGDWTDWEDGEPVKLHKVGPELWAYTMTLPTDAYLEYAYWQDGERVADPYSQQVTPNGMGRFNHFFYMPDGGPTPLRRRRRRVAHGTLTRHVIEEKHLVVGTRRTVHLYQPPLAQASRLLVVLDGQDYHRRAKLVNIVDNLIAKERIEPLALALVSNHPRERYLEYACNEALVGFLVARVLPLAQAELNLSDEPPPGQHAIMGASMGGLMALYAGLRFPQIFGRVLCQSGAFDYNQGYGVIWDLVRHLPVPSISIWMDAGRYEWLLDANRQMHRLLLDKGYDVAYHEFNGGHNYPAWRDDVGRGLEWLCPSESARPN